MAAGRAASAMRVVMDWVKSISIALVAWFLLRTFLIEAFRIPSGSMQNTLLVGDFLFVNKFLYGAEVPVLKKRLPAVREPERGEVIVFDSVEDDIKVVKRLIGVAGDTLEMRSGVVYRNGVKVEEPYAVNSNPSLSADPLKRAQMREWQVQHFAGPVPREFSPTIWYSFGPPGTPVAS